MINKLIRVLIVQCIFLSNMLVVQGMHLIPSMEQFTNALGSLNNLGTDAYTVGQIISNAQSLVSDTTHINPIIKHKLARLSFKVNKNIKTLVVLSRQLTNPRANKKRLTLNVIKTVEQIALYTKEFIVTYIKP